MFVVVTLFYLIVPSLCVVDTPECCNDFRVAQRSGRYCGLDRSKFTCGYQFETECDTWNNLGVTKYNTKTLTPVHLCTILVLHSSGCCAYD